MITRQHLLDLDDWSPDEILRLLDEARHMRSLLDEPGEQAGQPPRTGAGESLLREQHPDPRLI